MTTYLVNVWLPSACKIANIPQSIASIKCKVLVGSLKCPVSGVHQLVFQIFMQTAWTHCSKVNGQVNLEANMHDFKFTRIYLKSQHDDSGSCYPSQHCCYKGINLICSDIYILDNCRRFLYGYDESSFNWHVLNNV